MGNSNNGETIIKKSKNIIFIGLEILEQKYLLEKFFPYKIEQAGQIDCLKVTSIQRRNLEEVVVWLVKQDDLNFELTLQVLMKTLDIKGFIIYAQDENDDQMAKQRLFLKKYMCEEYLRDVSLGIIAFEEENDQQDGTTGEPDEALQQQQQMMIFLRKREIEKQLALREMDPRIMKQIQIMDTSQIGNLSSEMNQFLDQVLMASEI